MDGTHSGTPAQHIAALSPPRQRLLRLLQQVNFGRIRNLVIRNGEPVFDPPPQVLYDIKLDAPDQRRTESLQSNFRLKQRHETLFAAFDRIGDGTVERLEVREGLPMNMTVESQKEV